MTDITTTASINFDLSVLPLIKLELNPRISIDMDSSAPSSETTTLNDSSHDSMGTSPRVSICSSRTSNFSNASLRPKPNKRVRFEELVCWSYFDDEEDLAKRPQLRKKSSFLTRISWDRFSSRNSSAECDIATSPTSSSSGSRKLTKRNSSMDLLNDVNGSSPPRPSRRLVTVQQPLRERAGRRYRGAETVAYVKPKQCTPRGDWDDLLRPAKRNLVAV